MQLGRSYSRRLKKLKYEIYELYPSARHAYRHIDLAVKTSRPHMRVNSTFLPNAKRATKVQLFTTCSTKYLPNFILAILTVY